MTPLPSINCEILAVAGHSQIPYDLEVTLNHEPFYTKNISSHYAAETSSYSGKLIVGESLIQVSRIINNNITTLLSRTFPISEKSLKFYIHYDATANTILYKMNSSPRAVILLTEAKSLKFDHPIPKEPLVSLEQLKFEMSRHHELSPEAVNEALFRSLEFTKRLPHHEPIPMEAPIPIAMPIQEEEATQDRREPPTSRKWAGTLLPIIRLNPTEILQRSHKDRMTIKWRS